MRTCFVLMPLFDEFQEVFDAAIRPEINNAFGDHCRCCKADDVRRPGMVAEKIVQDLLNSDLVIAVAADPRRANSPNPNVMYELGIAHSFRKPTVLVADSETELPFDLRAVETIQLDFARFSDESRRAGFLADLRNQLRLTLKDPEILDLTEKRHRPRNPVTTQLSGTQIFIEDLPWLMGYCEVLSRERQARTVWEITRDLFWPSEPLFFESLRVAIGERKKHYFLVPNEEGVLRKAEAIKKELQEYLPKDEIDKHLRFVALESRYFLLWPIDIVLYDADYARGRGGIICEPMMSEIGGDTWDQEIRKTFGEYARSGDLDGFQRHLNDLEWTERRREATFDIRLDGRVVDALATTFTRLWNEKIREEAGQKVNEKERSALEEAWLIGGRQ